MSLRTLRTAAAGTRASVPYDLHLLADVSHHRSDGGHDFVAQLLRAQVLRQHCARIGRCRCASACLEQRTVRDIRDSDELSHLVRRHGAIQGVSERHGADEDQHDESHALLPIVRAVCEAKHQCR